MMEAPRQLPFPLRYDGDERRRSRARHRGAERRTPDPATEQDHPEEYELKPGELQ